MGQNKYLKFLVVALVLAVAVPQIVMAAWWNPFSWDIWQKIANVFNFQRTEQVQQAPQQPEEPEQVACTMDAKACPDGSYVGRVAPNCEFAPCPGPKQDETGAPSGSWKTYTNKNGWQINYPTNASIKEIDSAASCVEIKYGNGYVVIASPNGGYFPCGTTGVSEGIKKEDIVVIGEKNYKATGFIYKETGFMKVNTNSSLLVIEYGSANDFSNNFLISELKKIISTYKLIEQPIVGGDKDSHGCIGSAGYSWCEAKQKCLRTWEEKCE